MTKAEEIKKLEDIKDMGMVFAHKSECAMGLSLSGVR